MPNMTVSPNASVQAELLEAAVKAQLSKNLGFNLGPFLLGCVSPPTHRSSDVTPSDRCRLAFDTTLLGVLLSEIICWFSHDRKDRLFVKIVLEGVFSSLLRHS